MVYATFFTFLYAFWIKLIELPVWKTYTFSHFIIPNCVCLTATTTLKELIKLVPFFTFTFFYCDVLNWVRIGTILYGFENLYFLATPISLHIIPFLTSACFLISNSYDNPIQSTFPTWEKHLIFINRNQILPTLALANTNNPISCIFHIIFIALNTCHHTVNADDQNVDWYFTKFWLGLKYEWVDVICLERDG